MHRDRTGRAPTPHVQSLPVSRLTRFALTTLAVNLGVILWGALVRATGSGAGCGSHWPLCNGSAVPRLASAATGIELVHRLTSGVALLLVVALSIWCWRTFPRRHPARSAALASLALILIEAALGAGIVLLELVGNDASAARDVYMALHLGNTFLLLAALALTCWLTTGAPAPRWSRRPGAELALAAAGLLLVGASGAVTALGDTVFPAASVGAGLHQDLDASAHFLLRLRVVHPLLAVAVTGFLLVLPQRLGAARRGGVARRLGGAVSLLALGQLLVGATNVGLLAPIWLQLVHLLFADAVWLAFVLFAIAMLAPVTVPTPAASAPASAQPLAVRDRFARS
jgi:heme a synthase